MSSNPKRVAYAADTTTPNPNPRPGTRVKIQLPQKPPPSSAHSSDAEDIYEPEDTLSETYSIISSPSNSDGPTTPSSEDHEHRVANTEPPKTFADILPPTLITTSSISETGYYNKNKSRFGSKKGESKKRRSTLNHATPNSNAETISGLPASKRMSHPETSRSAPNGAKRNDDEDFDTPWAPPPTVRMKQAQESDTGGFKYDPKSYSPPSPGERGHKKSHSHSSTFSTASSSSKNSPSSSRVKEMMSSLRRSITKGGKGSSGDANRSYKQAMKERKGLPKSEDYGYGIGIGHMATGSGGGKGDVGQQGYLALSE